MFGIARAGGLVATSLVVAAVFLKLTLPSLGEGFEEDVWEKSRDLRQTVRRSGDDVLKRHDLYKRRLEAHPPRSAEMMLDDGRFKLYRAAIQTGNCAAAERVYVDA